MSFDFASFFVNPAESYKIGAEPSWMTIQYLGSLISWRRSTPLFSVKFEIGGIFEALPSRPGLKSLQMNPSLISIKFGKSEQHDSEKR